MLTTWASKHILSTCQSERTLTLLPCRNLVPIRVDRHEPLSLLPNNVERLRRRRPRPVGPRRPRYKPFLKRHRRIWRREPMTVCAAAIYSQGSAHAIMGISDRMITSWDVEYEPENHTKIFVFPSRPTEPYKI